MYTHIHNVFLSLLWNEKLFIQVKIKTKITKNAVLHTEGLKTLPLWNLSHLWFSASINLTLSRKTDIKLHPFITYQ